MPDFSALEVILICLSLVETIASAVIWHKWKKKYEKEYNLMIEERKQYELLSASFPILKNIL